MPNLTRLEPGDLIRAEFINAILADVDNLASRVAALETPGEATLPEGSLAVQYLGSEPSPVTAGHQALFHFSVGSIAQIPAEITITPRISPEAWDVGTALLDADRTSIPDGKVTIAPGGQRPFFVRLPQIPAETPAGTPFAVLVNVIGRGASAVFSQSLTVAESAPTGPPTIQVELLNAVPPLERTGPSSVRLLPGAQGVFTFEIRMNQAGTYNLAQTLVGENWLMLGSDMPPSATVLQGEVSAGDGFARRQYSMQIQNQAFWFFGSPGMVTIMAARSGVTAALELQLQPWGW